VFIAAKSRWFASLPPTTQTPDALARQQMFNAAGGRAAKKQ